MLGMRLEVWLGVRPAASLQSLPGGRCNSCIPPTTRGVAGSETSCIPPITTRWPVQQLHPSNHYQVAGATSCIPPITTRWPVQPAASLQSLPGGRCNQLHPSNHYQEAGATSCIPHVLVTCTIVRMKLSGK